jgi:hypothetical protein
MDIVYGCTRKLATGSVLVALALGAGCDGLCEQACHNRRIDCEESCDRHFNRELDPDGWTYCLLDCGSTHDGCATTCDQDDDY